MGANLKILSLIIFKNFKNPDLNKLIFKGKNGGGMLGELFSMHGPSILNR